MKTWVVAVGAILIVGIVLFAALRRPGEAPSTTPRPDPRAAEAELERRLAQDDSLTPPSADAPDAEWRAYERAIDGIRRGRDPISKGVLPETLQGEEMRRRLDTRRQAAEARHQEMREHAKERAEHARREAEEKARKMGWPDRPAPSPLFTPEPLPTPVSGAKDPRDNHR